MSDEACYETEHLQLKWRLYTNMEPTYAAGERTHLYRGVGLYTCLLQCYMQTWCKGVDFNYVINLCGLHDKLAIQDNNASTTKFWKSKFSWYNFHFEFLCIWIFSSFSSLEIDLPTSLRLAVSHVANDNVR